MKFALMRRSIRLLPVAGLIALIAANAAGGNHPEITWLPSSSTMLPSGAQNLSLLLPHLADGPADQPLILIGRLEPEPQKDVPPPSTQAILAQKPREFVLRVNGKPLPAWMVGGEFSHYVISRETCRESPEYGAHRLIAQVDVPAGCVLNLSAFGAPEILLAPVRYDGPLAGLPELASGDARTYLTALHTHLTGRIAAAQAEYQKLRSSADGQVARFARRAMRLAAYQVRPPADENDFRTARRTLLYLQQVGLFGVARFGGALVGPDDVGAADAWFRHSELADLFDVPVKSQRRLLEKAGFASGVTNPAEWQVMVTVLQKDDGAAVSPEQLSRIYEQWQIAERTIFAASQGMLRPRTNYAYFESTTVQNYVAYPGGLRGPADDLFATRGSFDSVISVRPGGRNDSVPAELGPNGAALSDLSVDCDSRVMLREWCRHFAWAVQTSESGPPLPDISDWIGYGMLRPAPNAGWGARAVLRYDVAPSVYRRTVVGGVGIAGTYVRRWQVEGPYATSLGDSTQSVVADLAGTWPPGGAARIEPRVVESRTDWIDLGTLLTGSGSRVARAATWVYVPREQLAAVWVGFLDRMALWVNGQCVRRGARPAAGRYATAATPDMTASQAWLREGWNRIEAVIATDAAPTARGFGFSMRLADWQGAPLVGAAYALRDPPLQQQAPRWTPPQVGARYDWDIARFNYCDSTPRLDESALRELTGLPTLALRAAVENGRGYFALGLEKPPAGLGYRALPDKWTDRDADRTLNNLIDWSREDGAVLSYEKAGQERTLLLVRPEALRAYLELLRENASAAAAFGGTRPSQRILGWVPVDAGASTFQLIAIDAALGPPQQWPHDEEDLLSLPVPPPASAPASAVSR